MYSHGSSTIAKYTVHWIYWLVLTVFCIWCTQANKPIELGQKIFSVRLNLYRHIGLQLFIMYWPCTTILFTLLVFCNKQVCTINVTSKSSYCYPILTGKLLHHHKYLKAPSLYYSNSSACFHIDILVCGNIHPNPGPVFVKRNRHYSISEFYKLRSHNGCKQLPSTTWKTLVELGISKRPTRTHRGKRAGTRKLQPFQREYTYLTSSLNVSHQISVLLQPHKIRSIGFEKRRSCTSNLIHIKPSVSLNVKRTYDLPILYLMNARSIKNKFDEIVVAVNNYNADILAITETWLDPDTPIDYFSMAGYMSFSKPRVGKKGGGVAAYIKHRFKPRALPIDVPDGLEVIWIHLRPTAIT